MAKKQQSPKEASLKFTNGTRRIITVCYLRHITTRPCNENRDENYQGNGGIISAGRLLFMVTNSHRCTTNFCGQNCFDSLSTEQKQIVIDKKPVQTRKHPPRGTAGFVGDEHKKTTEKLGGKLEKLRNLTPPKV